jgi:uncharacterized protein YqgV (UPF0045/DUF77 family)
MSESASRLSIVIKIDHRTGVHDALTSKVASVERHLHPDQSEPGSPPDPG